MKKIFCLFSLLLLTCLLMACEKPCEHAWSEATCTTPKTCSKCGLTEGEPSMTHSYVNHECKHCGTVELTLSNYKDYLVMSPTVGIGNIAGGDIILHVQGAVETSGNTHYKYKDVVLKVKFTHYDPDGYKNYLAYNLGIEDIEPEPYDESVCTVKVNLSGAGNGSCLLSTPYHIFTDEYSIYKRSDVFKRTMYEVIEVSGTVEEYK